METNILALNTAGTFWIMYNIFALSSLCIWILFIILEIYFLSFRQGYEGDGVRSCEVGFPAIFIPPAPARSNIRIYNYSKSFLIQNKIVFVHIYTTQNLFWNSMKAVTNPPPPRLQAPPSKSLCTLACGQNAHCEVDSFILNRPHHHHYYIISYC